MVGNNRQVLQLNTLLFEHRIQQGAPLSGSPFIKLRIATLIQLILRGGLSLRLTQGSIGTAEGIHRIILVPLQEHGTHVEAKLIPLRQG